MYETDGDGAAGDAESGQLVGAEQELSRQLAFPCDPVLAMNVRESSPDRLSSRSTTTDASWPFSLESEITARLLPSSGSRPKSVLSELRERLLSMSGLIELAQDSGGDDYAGAGGADDEQDLVQVGAAGDDVAELFAERGDLLAVYAPRSRRNASQRSGSSATGSRTNGTAIE